MQKIDKNFKKSFIVAKVEEISITIIIIIKKINERQKIT